MGEGRGGGDKKYFSLTLSLSPAFVPQGGTGTRGEGTIIYWK